MHEWKRFELENRLPLTDSPQMVEKEKIDAGQHLSRDVELWSFHDLWTSTGFLSFPYLAYVYHCCVIQCNSTFYFCAAYTPLSYL